MKKLQRDEILEKLENLQGWKADETFLKIERKFQFSNFTDGVCFLNQIAEFAEELNHHPDFHLTNYKYLKVVLSTHSAGGLTQLDFKMAAKIQEVFRETQAHLSD